MRFPDNGSSKINLLAPSECCFDVKLRERERESCHVIARFDLRVRDTPGHLSQNFYFFKCHGPVHSPLTFLEVTCRRPGCYALPCAVTVGVVRRVTENVV